MIKYMLLAVMALAIAAPSFSYAQAEKDGKPAKHAVKKVKKHKSKKVKAEAAPASATPAATTGNK